MEGTVAEAAAAYLEANAEGLVNIWIDWVKERVDTPTISALPERALRNHIPPVLVSLARFLRDPIELSRQDLLNNLRLHGQIRRDQGYSLEEVLAEFDGLADVVTRRVADAVSDSTYSDGPDGMLQLANRLATGLRSISYIAMGMYNEFDLEREKHISHGLEDLSRAVMHELRNALQMISVGLDAIRADRSGEKVGLDKRLDTLGVALQRSDYLLDTLRVVSVSEYARTGDRIVRLVEGVDKVLRELSDLSASDDIEILVADDLPDLHAEAIILYIFLVNTVSNAIKYHDSGKQKKWIKISATYIDEEHDSGFCEIVVEDNGIGVPEEFVPRLFQRGFRGHPNHATGTGLGLFLVHEALTARGGKVDVESVDGEGTRVIARIRCLQPEGSPLTADQFRVEHLLGLSAYREMTGKEPPTED